MTQEQLEAFILNAMKALKNDIKGEIFALIYHSKQEDGINIITPMTKDSTIELLAGICERLNINKFNQKSIEEDPDL